MGDTKLDKSNVEDIYRLTPLQEGMLFHYLTDVEHEQYFEQLSLNISGTIKTDVFQRAWNIVAENNEILRTVFRWTKLEKPLQIVLKKVELPIKIIDLSMLDMDDQCRELDGQKFAERQQKIDISTAPFKITLCKLSDDKYEMIISNHHIIYDGWSNGIILNEFFENYNDLYSGKQPEKKTKTKFKDFVKYIGAREKQTQQSYWENYLAGFNTVTPLPVDNKVRTKYRKLNKISYVFSENEINKINGFLKTHRITSAALFSCAWGILLQKYNNLNDVLFGMAVSGRPSAIKGIEDMVGLFINTLPVRVHSDSDVTVLDLMKRNNTTLIDHDEYSSTPLSDINSYRKSGEGSFFNSILVLENYPLNAKIMSGEYQLKVNSFSIQEMTNFDLSLQVLFHDGLELLVHYEDSMFASGTMERLVGYFIHIIHQAIEVSSSRIDQFMIYTEAEKTSILSYLNENVHTLVPKNQTLQQVLFQSFDANQDRIAIEFLDYKVSYRELDIKSNKIASELMSRGIEKEAFVGILLDSKVDLIICMIGILKAGCAFVPIDVTYPRERIRTMLETTNTKYIFTDDRNIGLLHGFDNEIRIINVDTQVGEAQHYLQRPQQSYDSNDRTYVFFTSGSTGTPKAVIGRNESLLHFVDWEIREFHITKEVKVSQFTSPCHNPLLRDVFVPLCAGGTICVPDSKEMILDSDRLMEWIEKTYVSLIHCTPSLFKLINGSSLTANKYPSLKNVLLAGERTVPKDLVSWYDIIGERIQLVSLYGQTETTLAKVFYRIKPADSMKDNIPIGKPMNGVRVAIMDSNAQLCPQGFKGEICIRTPYRSLGYYNNVALNREKFIVNPYRDDPADIIYRTGDLGRFLPDGNIEFLGRIDRQIKIRGFRIELNEVENAILVHGKVKEASVIAKENSQGNTYLCAYLVLFQDNEMNEKRVLEDIRHLIAQKLPDYMIPQYLIPIDRMPMNLNGKLDYKLLPEPKQLEYVAPENEVERMVAELWCEILEVDQVGRNDRFLEIGGHSLNVMSLIFKVLQQFKVELPLTEVFKNISVADLALFINNSKQNEFSNVIEAVEKREYYPQSSTQRGMFILNQLQKENTFYNIPYVATIEGQLDIQRFNHAFESLIKRHESLRTSFHYVNGEPVQRVADDASVNLEVVNDAEADIDSAIKEFIRPFDLEAAPLMRVKLISIRPNKYYLLFDIHHIISDGVSMTIIIRDLLRLYHGEELAPLRVHYKDYVEWKNKMNASSFNSEQEQYWLNVFNKPVERLMMQTDFPRPSNVSYDGNVVKFILPKSLTNKLNDLSKQFNCTLFMIFLSSFNLLLHKYTQQEDIVVGVPILGRTNPDTENVVGAFINLLAMRNAISPNRSFADFLMQVKDNSMKAFTHQEYSFEDLVSKLNLHRDMSRQPIFDLLFVMQNMGSSRIEMESVSVEPYEIKRTTSKYDISLLIIEQNNELFMELEYAVHLFKESTINQLGKHFLEILGYVIVNPNQSISEIKLSDTLQFAGASALEFDEFNF
ncbi:amino acid adenylation domain-containing protein [Paenibacillus sp. FSL W8-0439]|uniref:amino acid adenylation domain-containing protein n=1 Tax=Paenibacillus sp. FSL W8-0439 TaxID=2921716 RepID=UPI0030F9B75F